MNLHTIISAVSWRGRKNRRTNITMRKGKTPSHKSHNAKIALAMAVLKRTLAI